MNYSKSIITSFLCIFLFSLNAQKLDLKEFNEVNVAAGLQVELIASDKNYADVEMIKGDRDDIIITVKNGTLRLKAESSFFGKTAKARIDVYYNNEINGIDVSSGSTLKSADILKTERLDLDASSGASCKVNIDVDELDISVSSGARVTLRGDANAQEIDVSSGANYAAKELISKYADVSASSGANAEVYCSKRIKAEASSGGSINYYGNPKEQDFETGKWSGGSIKAK